MTPGRHRLQAGIALLFLVSMFLACASPAALHEAIAADRTDEALKLIRSGADLNATNKEQGTPLELAAALGRLDLVRELVDRGADINLAAPPQPPPVHLAIRNQQVETVQFLIEKGANLESRAPLDRSTPLIEAVHSGNGVLIRTLLDAGADIRAEGGVWGSALNEAAFLGDAELVLELVRRGADGNAANSSGATPLYCAASNEESDVLEYLLSGGADPNITLKGSGMSPLHRAAAARRLANVTLLLARGAKATHRSIHGVSPLNLAVMQMQQPDALTDALVAAGATANPVANDMGMTAASFWAVAVHQERMKQTAAARVSYESAATIYERMADRAKQRSKDLKSQAFRRELAAVLGPILMVGGARIGDGSIAGQGIIITSAGNRSTPGHEQADKQATDYAQRARRCREGATRCP